MAAYDMGARRHKGAGRFGRRAGIVALAALAALTLAALGCYNNNTGETKIGESINFTLPAFPETGTHAVQVFTEMHYQPSYEEQEIPRLLPPPDSVPVTGREVRYGTIEEYRALAVSEASAQSYDDADAADLYDVNCAVCHGAALDGQGLAATITGADGQLAWDKEPVPANLHDATTVAATDGELFGFISLGGRQGLSARLRDRETTSPMPEFMKMLSADERWTLVQFLRARIGGP